MSDFEIAGTNFHQGVFELYLEKKPPKFLRWIIALGPMRARAVGLLMLIFSFVFSTSQAPRRFIMENHWAADLPAAAQIQQTIGYTIFGIAVVFYLTVFFFRREKMDLVFNKNSKLLIIEREPLFRLAPTKRGHVTFQEITKIQTVSAAEAPPHGLVRIVSRNTTFRDLEFKVLTDEQFEYFPLNIERILGI